MTPLPREFLTRPLAHRGYHDQTRGIPENSRLAFEAAAVAGYGIELDVQISADGEAMVFHDFQLDRLTAESGPVQKCRRSELEAMELQGGAETIPALDEVLALVAGRVPVLVEVKKPAETGISSTDSLERAIARAVIPYAGPVAVMSFNPYAVESFATAAPDIPRGLTTGAFRPEDWPDLSTETLTHLRDVSSYDRLKVTFISHCKSDLQSGRVAELKTHGAHVLCWTVLSAEQEMKARSVADNITFEGYPAVIPTS